MQIVAKTGREDIAVVYLAETENGKLIEFVESLQPPHPREEKWILTLSTLHGCPVGCLFCDAGNLYLGKLSQEEILSQIDFLVRKRYSEGRVPVKKFKIQFARMGEPSFNPNVLSVLERLIDLYEAPGLMLSLSTIAPKGREDFFERLLEIKRKKYSGKFQFQFSLHTTEEALRKWLIPVSTLTFGEMAEYGKAFYETGERKITLNFALAEGMPVDPNILLKHFDPDHFLIKITPVNPTLTATKNNISSGLLHHNAEERVAALRNAGYEVILSIGELEENYIGSNCGQYVTTYKVSQKTIESGYTYELQKP